MADSRALAGEASQSLSYPPLVGAGIIKSIRVENFMCHDHYVFDLCDWVNFITGQNGSGKSAILTALCIAFGCRAKGTQRASTLKDFIKTGCSYAAVHVEVKNEGEDAFKPEIFGDVIIIERRITASSSSIILKDHQGKKVATRNKELRELVEHFNIDVENPCVVMSQDNSREFLHSGNDKDKFKATLLQQVNDLLVSIGDRLNSAKESLKELEELIKPVLKEIDELQVKIKNMEHIEVISQQVQQLKKKLAWSWVYDVDMQLKKQSSDIKKLKERIPTCQAKIDEQLHSIKTYGVLLTEKRTHIGHMLTKTSEVRRAKDELQEKLSLARTEMHKLEEEHRSQNQHIKRMVKHARLLEQQLQEIHEHHARNTQAEESEMEEKLNKIQLEIDAANSALTRLKEEENSLLESSELGTNEVREIADEIGEYERKLREIRNNIRQFQQHHTNKVTAFGGEKVIQLLRAIEKHQHRFKSPPIGPIGAHLTLADGDMWAVAIEHAIGRLLNAFVVTCLDDSRVLRALANEINYKRLQILIYDFSRPRLNIPSHMLPQSDHPTILSVLRSESPTVMNVLIDMGSVERQVLVRDYDAGKTVAFEQRVLNLKEVYTKHGHKMFSRGSVETVLPPIRNIRAGRLCSSYDNQIRDLETDAASMQEHVKVCQKRKRAAEEKINDLQYNLQNAKRRRYNAERELMSKNLAFQDIKRSYVAETNMSSESTVDELRQEISRAKHEINEKERLMEDAQIKLKEADAKASSLRLSFEKLCESANVEINALEKAERELTEIEKDIHSADSMKAHYEGVMKNTVLRAIEEAHAHYKVLENSRKESHEKASTICPEDEILALGDWDGSSPEELSAQVKRLNQRLQRESEQYSESIDDLKMMYENKRRKIQRRRQTYEGYGEKLNACEKALETRWNKFQRNASLLKRQLTWQFNGHLRKKGISGHIKVSYEERTLSIEVKMPQDSSNGTVRDTRGLSGGERSFSTLCFTLALHEMTEAPFRAMDEFDVFMDAVSRKISLDTVVDFALAQGSQWIFLTPHDISMVKEGERIKKLQLAAPRS